jgi:RNA polymerase sigma-B factor
LITGPWRDPTVVEGDDDDTTAPVESPFECLARTGDHELRNALIERHLELARFHAHRFASAAVAYDDMLQVARLALVMAVDRFDPTRGVTFGTFAARTMQGECKRYLRDRTWAVRPPRDLHELHGAVRRHEEMLIQRLGRSPTVDEIAASVRDTPEHVLEALEAGRNRNGLSTDGPPPGRVGDGTTIGDGLAAVDDDIGSAQDRALVAALTVDLDERDRHILHRRFALQHTEAEIAEGLGVSQSYLSRRLRRILGDLRRRSDRST